MFGFLCLFLFESWVSARQTDKRTDRRAIPVMPPTGTAAWLTEQEAGSWGNLHVNMSGFPFTCSQFPFFPVTNSVINFHSIYMSIEIPWNSYFQCKSHFHTASVPPSRSVWRPELVQVRRGRPCLERCRSRDHTARWRHHAGWPRSLAGVAVCCERMTRRSLCPSTDTRVRHVNTPFTRSSKHRAGLMEPRPLAQM